MLRQLFFYSGGCYAPPIVFRSTRGFHAVSQCGSRLDSHPARPAISGAHPSERKSLRSESPCPQRPRGLRSGTRGFLPERFASAWNRIALSGFLIGRILFRPTGLHFVENALPAALCGLSGAFPNRFSRTSNRCLPPLVLSPIFGPNVTG